MLQYYKKNLRFDGKIYILWVWHTIVYTDMKAPSLQAPKSQVPIYIYIYEKIEKCHSYLNPFFCDVIGLWFLIALRNVRTC